MGVGLHVNVDRKLIHVNYDFNMKLGVGWQIVNLKKKELLNTMIICVLQSTFL